MKKLLVLLIVLAVIAAGVAYLMSDHSSWGGGASGPVGFTVKEPVHGDLYEVVGGSGFVQPRDTVVISTELNGRVIKILADFNDVVESGDDIVQLDDQMVQARLDQVQRDKESTQKAIEVAETDKTKATTLRDAAKVIYEDVIRLAPGTYSKPQIQDIKARLDAADAAVHMAERSIELARTRQAAAEAGVKLAQLPVTLSTIKVPYIQRPTGDKARPGIRDIGVVIPDGAASGEPKTKFMVLDRKITLNQMIGPPNMTHLFTLVADLNEVDVQVQVNESDIGKVRPGQKVFFTVSAFQDENKVFTGEVVETRQLPTIVQGAVSYTVLVKAKNESDGHGRWLLRPGMTTASVDIVTGVKKDVWAIPNTALDFQLDESYHPAGSKEAIAAMKDPGWVSLWVQEGEAAKLMWVKPQQAGKIADKNGVLSPEQFTLVEWRPEMNNTLKPGQTATYPKLIVGAPPAKKGKLFNLPSVVKF